MSNTYGAPAPNQNPLTSSLDAITSPVSAGIGLLNPSGQQAQQNQRLTAQQLKDAQELANTLRNMGLTSGKYTSPWQVAAQWVAALKGNLKQQDVNQGYRQLNKLTEPSPTPQQPGAPGAPPSTGGDQSFPWRGGRSGGQSQTPPQAQSAEAAAVNAGTWQPAPDYQAGLVLAQPYLNNPPPGGLTMPGRPGATYDQIMGGGS